MRRYRPMKIIATGKWHFCVEEGDSPPRAVGACAKGCSGHKTPEAAVAHYKNDLVMNLEQVSINQMKFKCVICGAQAHSRLSIPGTIIESELCADHLTYSDFASSIQLVEFWVR